MSSESRTRWTVALVAALTITTTGGCAVTKEQDPRDEAVASLLADGRLEVDLAEGPTREDLAVPEGRKTFIIQDEDLEPFRTTVTFSDGHVLDLEKASFVSVETDGTSDPTRLVVGVNNLALDEMAALLEAGVESFGLDRARVDAFLRSADDAEENGRFSQRAFPADVAAPESLEVQPIVRGTSGRFLVNYLISWEG